MHEPKDAYVIGLSEYVDGAAHQLVGLLPIQLFSSDDACVVAYAQFDNAWSISGINESLGIGHSRIYIRLRYQPGNYCKAWETSVHLDYGNDKEPS